MFLKYNPMSQIKSKVQKRMLKKRKKKKLEKACLSMCIRTAGASLAMPLP